MNPKVIAWTASGAAVFLAFLPVAFYGFERARYDPEVAVLTATLLALIWYTYHTHQSVEEARRAPVRQADFRREGLAAALLMELQQLQKDLRDGIKLLQLRPRSPVLYRALAQVEVFPSDVAALMSELVISLEELADLRRQRQEIKNQRPWDREEYKADERKVKELNQEIWERGKKGARDVEELAERLRKLPSGET